MNNMYDIKAYYDYLVGINNDPVNDPPPLKEYMKKWDGDMFFDELSLDNTKTVLEIGVGTGRIAIDVLPYVKHFTGIDISEKTIERAEENLSNFNNKLLICDDFLKYEFKSSFDIIYSSLTFMHFKEKKKAIEKAYQLLNPFGRFVLSISKDKSDTITIDDEHKIIIYPDDKENIKEILCSENLNIIKETETEFAYIFVAVK